MVFSSFFKCSLIFMNMQIASLMIFKTCKWWFDDGLRLKSVYLLYLTDISLIFKVFVNIPAYAYKIICIFGNGKNVCV